MLITTKPYSFAGAKENGAKTPLQIFDLLQLSRQEREAKLFCMQTIRTFSKWRKTIRRQEEIFSKVSFSLEEILLRRAACEALQLYRTCKERRVKAFEAYLEKLPAINNTFHSI